MVKNPKICLKQRSKKIFEICALLSLVFHLSIFLSFKRFHDEVIPLENVEDVLEVTDIPETEQIKKPPPPQAPMIPIESEDEELLEDVTMDKEDFNFWNFDNVPPPPRSVDNEDEIPTFLPLEDHPQMIGGLQALQKLISYPKLAKIGHIEGYVSLNFLVTPLGVAADIKVVKSLHESCDKEAVNALKKMKFIPAMQRDRAVPYRMNIRVRFKLK